MTTWTLLRCYQEAPPRKPYAMGCEDKSDTSDKPQTRPYKTCFRDFPASKHLHTTIIPNPSLPFTPNLQLIFHHQHTTTEIMSQLAPFNPPLGPQPPNPAFYSPTESTLQMKEKLLSLSGDSFTITNTSGAPVCQCTGKVFSLHGTKTFTDMQGNELFTVKKKMLSIQKKLRVREPRRPYVHFKNAADGQEVQLDLKGDWFDRSATITLGGRPVADVKRKFFNARELFGDKQTYFVTVAPNVDLTLIAAICVCLDERENEK
ncbi:hypothetical protein Q7P37_002797 [Cladosporium fusiforme]